jgi:hypothetical protein
LHELKLIFKRRTVYTFIHMYNKTHPVQAKKVTASTLLRF